ncbi:ribonuclease [Flavisphingomonas formosensis]|uniref:ribonuclease n=1 Tax=Flavisphingomonas formosensis TaxID=861534 RepID=UPI0012F8608C|nr:ribonuclease [Sphingomonas formosensis]
MAEWLYEDGIGEARAALIDKDEIVAMRLEWPDEATRLGTIVPARMLRGADATGRALVALEGGTEALLEAPTRGLNEGAKLVVEIVREPIAERGRLKPAKARVAAEGSSPAPGPDLRQQIASSGLPVTQLHPHQPDLLEQHGWSERLEQARDGDIAFPWGALQMAVTPAMTLFDVDGALAPAELALHGAEAAARMMMLFDITGSIGIDLPTVESKAARQAAAAALDAVLPQPFERTAVNGFGFLQVVRRRFRASIPEMLHADPAGASARALLRLAERTPGMGMRTLVAHPAVIARIERESEWRETLARRIGTAVALRGDAALAISAGHVEARYS